MAWKLVIDVYCCFHFPLSHMSLFCSIPTRPLLVGFGCRPSAASLVKWWIAGSLGAIAPQHSGEKSGCTTTRLYSVLNYIWYFFKPDWYRGAHFTASIHVYVALPCHFRCSCVVWVLCSFSLSVVPCAVWDASGVWRNGQLLLLQEDGRHHPSSSPSHFISSWNILSAVHNHWKWPLSK